MVRSLDVIIYIVVEVLSHLTTLSHWLLFVVVKGYASSLSSHRNDRTPSPATGLGPLSSKQPHSRLSPPLASLSALANTEKWHSRTGLQQPPTDAATVLRLAAAEVVADSNHNSTHSRLTLSVSHVICSLSFALCLVCVIRLSLLGEAERMPSCECLHPVAASCV